MMFSKTFPLNVGLQYVLHLEQMSLFSGTVLGFYEGGQWGAYVQMGYGEHIPGPL